MPFGKKEAIFHSADLVQLIPLRISSIRNLFQMSDK
jgi:hypothetical protein